MEYNKDSENLEEHGMKQKTCQKRHHSKEKKELIQDDWTKFWVTSVPMIRVDRDQELEIVMSRGAPR